VRCLPEIMTAACPAHNVGVRPVWWPRSRVVRYHICIRVRARARTGASLVESTWRAADYWPAPVVDVSRQTPHTPPPNIIRVCGYVWCARYLAYVNVCVRGVVVGRRPPRRPFKTGGSFAGRCGLSVYVVFFFFPGRRGFRALGAFAYWPLPRALRTCSKSHASYTTTTKNRTNPTSLDSDSEGTTISVWRKTHSIVRKRNCKRNDDAGSTLLRTAEGQATTTLDNAV